MCGDTQGRERGAELKLAVLRPFVLWLVRPRRAKPTPAEMVDKLNNEINAGLADPKLKARLGELGGTALALSPAEFGKLFAEDTDKWGKVVRAADMKLETSR